MAKHDLPGVQKEGVEMGLGHWSYASIDPNLRASI